MLTTITITLLALYALYVGGLLKRTREELADTREKLDATAIALNYHLETGIDYESATRIVQVNELVEKITGAK